MHSVLPRLCLIDDFSCFSGADNPGSGAEGVPSGGRRAAVALPGAAAGGGRGPGGGAERGEEHPAGGGHERQA